MRKFTRIALMLVLSATVLGSCERKPDVGVNGNEESTLGTAAPEIKWIYTEMCDNYYWNKAVKAAEPDFDLEYKEFLKQLIVGLGSKARDSDGTMDGYIVDGVHHLYSYIERRESGTRAEIDNNYQTTFGFGFQPFWADTNKTYLAFLITWVQPGGPAALEELKRGVWITKYNGKNIKFSDYEDFFYQWNELKGGMQMKLTDVDGKDYTINAAGMNVSPILHHDIVTSGGGRKAGYLLYNEFHPGENNKYDNELRDIFAGFNTDGVTEMILDLRYNHGGYVSSCRTLTGLVSNANSSLTFGKYKFNDGVMREEKFTQEPKALQNLNGKTVYVLATGESASASEMIINSLRGIDFTVVHIGEITNGKNVGMTLSEKTIDGYDYEMWPITFRIYNAKNQSDYPNGFEPTKYIDEFRNNKIYELGDTREELLKAALTLIDGGTVTEGRGTRADDRPAGLGSGLNMNRGGAKLLPKDLERLRN